MRPADSPAIELTVLMPCLNESRTLGDCISRAREFLESAQVRGEILVADNGSTDGSAEIAEAAGARIVKISKTGYGCALMGGIQAAHGEYIVMGDADMSYDFRALQPFLKALREGADLVIGNRFLGGIAPGAMPFLHRYLGNPVLSFVGRLFYPAQIGDFHCGLRGFRRERLLALGLRTPGMEFASEMIVKAALNGYRIEEVPTTLSPDGRGHPPHLDTWSDGWRHLRFLLLLSPRWLFLIPGLALLGLGSAGMLALIPGPVTLGETRLDIHSMLYCSAAVVCGLQAVFFAVFAKLTAIRQGLLPRDDRLTSFLARISLEKGLTAGLTMVGAGILLTLFAVLEWGAQSFGPLIPSEMMRVAIPAVTLFLAGATTLFASFFLSLLNFNQVDP